MNKRRFRDWTLEDPEVQQILAGAIRSSKQSYYRVINGRHVKATLKAELMKLPMNGLTASKLLAEYPFPEAPFIRNRKRDANLSEEDLLALRERQAIRKAKAANLASQDAIPIRVPADAKEIKKSDTVEPTQAIEEVSEESASEQLELSVNETEERRGRSKKSDPDEELSESKNHCIIQRGEWFGIFNTRDATVHLVSKDKSEAVSALAQYGRVKECFRWS